MHVVIQKQWHGTPSGSYLVDVGLTSLIPHCLTGEERRGEERRGKKRGNPLSQKVVRVKNSLFTLIFKNPIIGVH